MWPSSPATKRRLRLLAGLCARQGRRRAPRRHEQGHERFRRCARGLGDGHVRAARGGQNLPPSVGKRSVPSIACTSVASVSGDLFTHYNTVACTVSVENEEDEKKLYFSPFLRTTEKA